MFLFQIEIVGHYFLWLYFLHCSCANKISNGFNKNYTDNLTDFFLLLSKKLPEKAFVAKNSQKKPFCNWKKKISWRKWEFSIWGCVKGKFATKINVKLHLSRPASAMKISSLPPSQDTSTRDHLRIFQQLPHQMVG